jgi:hypothetical protein
MPEQLTRVRALGVYRVECTSSLLIAAMDYKYGRVWNPVKKWLLKAAVRQEIELAVLVELRVPPPNSDFDLGKIGQEGSDQAAYDEHYLSDDGESVISNVSAPEGSPWQRVAFYFHFFDENKPLLTAYGPVHCPPPAPMPERLHKLMPYEPVD